MDTDHMQIVGQLEAVWKKFGSYPVLDGISLEIRAGEVTALLGPNGAGKTTTVGLLTGRLTPDGARSTCSGSSPRARSPALAWA